MDGSVDIRTVNLDGMCRILGVSAPTLSKLLKDCPDLPVIEQGGRGREWAFDPEAVLAWVVARKEAAQAQVSAQLEFIEQLRGEGEGEAAPDKMSPSQQLQMVKARREERKLAQEAGMLVEAASLRQALAETFAAIPALVRNAANEGCRRHRIPEDAIRAVITSIDERWAQEVRTLQRRLRESGVTEQVA